MRPVSAGGAEESMIADSAEANKRTTKSKSKSKSGQSQSTRRQPNQSTVADQKKKRRSRLNDPDEREEVVEMRTGAKKWRGGERDETQ